MVHKIIRVDWDSEHLFDIWYENSIFYRKFDGLTFSKRSSKIVSKSVEIKRKVVDFFGNILKFEIFNERSTFTFRINSWSGAFSLRNCIENLSFFRNFIERFRKPLNPSPLQTFTKFNNSLISQKTSTPNWNLTRIDSS